MDLYSDFNKTLKERFSDFEPDILALARPQAAVLVPIVLKREPSVLLTVRASHLNSHPGQVSFPGGMVEKEDQSLIHTALRESFEEVSLMSESVDVLGQLSTAFSKDGVQVYPVVGTISSATGTVANPDEIAEIFEVPWRFFASEAPELQQMERHGLSFQIPHYHYEGKHIWGLTAMILLELVNLVEGTDWPLPNFSAASRPGETP